MPRITSDITARATWPLLYWPSEGECFLVRDFNVGIWKDDAIAYLEITAGNKTYDGLSARKIAALIQIEPGRSDPAWLIHDELYMRRGRVSKNVKLTRKECDELFRQALVALGYGEKRSRLAYWAVRIGGRWR